ncbi:MAG: GntR family transcriptional regulator [Rubrivivax sp.]|jgi:GntR family transcriptional regulator of vanillate catabolism|nr:GntR family transcriptional regulator [Rubrivivax sp.]
MNATADLAEPSQTVRVQLRLRELILGGELKPGARIAELTLVERLGASRTPIRMALVRLQEEGLLEALPHGGFAVKDFSESDIHDAIELRGTLEGLCARLAAERGVSTVLMNEARDCVEQIDALLAAPSLSEESFTGYVQHNGRFHDLLAEMAGSDMVRHQLERAKTLPFASPNGFVLARSTGADARDALVVAQAQHRGVLDAIRQREGSRAESLMREHARIAHGNLRAALADHRSWQRVPGASLIRRRPSR